MENTTFDNKQKELREQLMARPTPVHFTYRKADGTIRDAIGTLRPGLIPVSKEPKSPNLNDNPSLNLRYYDLQKEAWRSLTQDCSIINILD
jgi:hypothetical protein